MLLDEKYLARRWLRRRVKWAQDPSSHPDWAQFLKERYRVTVGPQGSYQGGDIKNPKGRGQPTVVFSTAYKDSRFRQQVHNEFEQWRRRLEPRDQPKRTPAEQMAEEGAQVALARGGKIASKERLGEDTINDAYLVSIKDDDREGKFIFKPSIGSTKKLLADRGVMRARKGIDQDLQHIREEANYRADRMLGPGGVVPPTAARHSGDSDTDGSYQQYVDATPLYLGLSDLPKKVNSAQLAANPSFQRMQILDLIQGHEDRHAKNVMYYFEGDATPENLRFVAIDNGLSAADPQTTRAPEDYVWVDAFNTWFDPSEIGEEDYNASPDLNTVEGPDDDEWIDVPLSGQQAVEKVLTHVPDELHERLKKIDLGDFVKEQLASGLEPEAAQAAAVRLAALQADPEILGVLFWEVANGESLKEAWQEFQYMSGHQGKELLEMAQAPGKWKEIQAALKHVD